MRIASALAVATLLMGLPSEAQAACTQGRDVAADLGGRVYTDKGRWYACARTATKPIRVVGARKDALARVTYPYAAVTVGADKVRVYDLRRRAKAGVRAPGAVTDLVLTRDGVATFVAGGQVLRMTAAGAVVTVAPGPATPGSLAASNDAAHVYWMEGGAARLATFAAVPRFEFRSRRERHCGRARTVAHAADAGGWLVFHEAGYEFLGCLRSGHRKPISFEPGDDVYAATVASPFVGVVLLGASPYGSGSNEVTIYNLREGDDFSYSARSWVSQLELSSSGVAYILEAGAVDIYGAVIGLPELFVLTPPGSVTALDKGAIAQGSLTLTPDGRRAYWTKDGVALTR
ncbi:hypothetical protein OJ998_28410 [Solirubrobacter taibaiensis]|nr:hypothetical protein [Solirubrobacter taibaiensis]